MKKIISLFIVAIMACACISTVAPTTALAADETNSFIDTFFGGEIDSIPDIYYQITKGDWTDNKGKPEAINMWLTQPDEIFEFAKFVAEKEEAEESWLEEFNLESLGYCIQLDCKLDDGSYQFADSWNIGEYDEDNLPDSMIYSYKITDCTNAERKSYVVSTSCLNASYGENERGFLEDAIQGRGGDNGYYFDLDNHSLSLRARYLFRYRIIDEEENQFIHSEWSAEVVLGKGGTQEELVEPTKIEAPIISNLQFISGEERDGIAHSKWSVDVQFSDSIVLADRYFKVEKNAFEPLNAIIQYRVKRNKEWGEWRNSYWGNSDWLNSGSKEFDAEGAGENDTIEFRVYLDNTVEGYKDSEYSNVLSCNAEKIDEGGTGGGQLQDDPKEKPETEKDKCKLCGICPVQPLGICLFVWLVIIIAVVVIAIYLINKRNKDKKEEN